MNIASSRRTALAFLAFATILLPFFPLLAASQSPTLATLAKIREHWLQDLHTKQLEPILKFYAPDAVFLHPPANELPALPPFEPSSKP